MSIYYKDTDSQEYSEVGIGSDRITVERAIELIRKKENLGELDDITLLNANTKERLEKDQFLRSNTRVMYQLNDAFDGFDDEDILEHVMNTNKGPAQEPPKPMNTRPNYQRFMPPKYPPKLPETSKSQQQQKNNNDSKGPEDLAESMKCLICKNIMRDAVQLLCCNEAFCEECIRKKSKCPSCNTDVNENNIIPNKSLREQIKKHMEPTNNDIPSPPANPVTTKQTEVIERSYDEPKAPPHLEKRESFHSQDPETSNTDEENYPPKPHAEPRHDYRPPGPGFFQPAPPMYNKPPPPMSRPNFPAGYPPNPAFRGNAPGMFPPQFMGYPNHQPMYGYPPMYGGYPPQMNPYMYPMRGFPNPYDGMDPNNPDMEYNQNEEEEEEVKSEKSKKSKKHKHKKHSSPEKSRSRSRSESEGKNTSRTKNKNRSRSRSPSKKKHKKNKKHRK